MSPRPTTVPARYPERMRTDRELVDAILDETLYCNLAFVVDGAPRLLPSLHVRVDDVLYLHGSTGSTPMLRAAADDGAGPESGGLRVCVSVTVLDGLVFARSQFHHSLNYRSVIAHGVAAPVSDEDTLRAVLAALVDKVAAGRAADSRPPNRKELASTALLALPLTEAAAKVRTGGANDDDADLDLPHWAGVLPLRLVAGNPEPADPTVPVPAYLRDWGRD